MKRSSLKQSGDDLAESSAIYSIKRNQKKKINEKPPNLPAMFFEVGGI